MAFTFSYVCNKTWLYAHALYFNCNIKMQIFIWVLCTIVFYASLKNCVNIGSILMK